MDARDDDPAPDLVTPVRDEDYETFVRTRRPAMVRTATALVLGDRHRAEDLVQRALVKIYLAWSGVTGDNLDGYAHRVLVNVFIDERRRPFARRERVVRDVPDTVADDGSGGPNPELDPELVAALRALPKGMRAVVVLRYVQDLSVDETAALVGCSPGTVKSQAARGLAKLRDALDDHHLEPTLVRRPS